ncbi:MAG: cell division inhibitor, partial [Eudoraea sp.]|nr:cell division inhibitor [Eudoraea sp.]
YSLWHHKHFIRKVDQGVEMEDVIHYKLPLGWLGRLAHPILVKKQLKQIFSYRETKLSELFGTIPGKSAKLEFKSF